MHHALLAVMHFPFRGYARNHVLPGQRARFETISEFWADDPARLISRSEKLFFKPEMPFEKTGQYAAGTTFVEGLVFFKRKWFLYYGCADSLVGVAETP